MSVSSLFGLGLAYLFLSMIPKEEGQGDGNAGTVDTTEAMLNWMAALICSCLSWLLVLVYIVARVNDQAGH